MVQMVDKHKGLYKEIRCVYSLDPIWDMGLVYGALDAFLIPEVGPLISDSLLGRLVTDEMYST